MGGGGGGLQQIAIPVDSNQSFFMSQLQQRVFFTSVHSIKCVLTC